MYCNNCGANILNDSTFCPHCGTAIQQQYLTIEKTDTTAYENVLKSQSEKETKIDQVVGAIEIVIGICFFVYYIVIGNDILSSAIASLILAVLICAVTIHPIVNKYKKMNNLYKASAKYAKYQELLSSMNKDTAIQTVEIEFNNIKNEHSHGILYFLLCILTIIVIFSLC